MTATTVTLSLLLEEQRQGKQLYSPAPGTRYEVARGLFVTLRPPTLALQEQFFEQSKALDDKNASVREAVERTVAVARTLTEGAWPGLDEVMPNIVNRIVLDFMYASDVIERPATIASDAYDRLIDQALSKLRGQENGLPETAAAES